MANDIRCAVIEIHGIGNQKPDWSKDFDTALTGQLTDDEQARLARKAVWCANTAELTVAVKSIVAATTIAPYISSFLLASFVPSVFVIAIS